MNMSQVECNTDDRIHFQISVTGSVNGDSVQKGSGTVKRDMDNIILKGELMNLGRPYLI